MGQVVVKVNGREFPLTCADGQESRIRRLAQYVDAKVGEFTKTVGQVGEARLILLAALVIADELSDANEALRQERNRQGRLGRRRSGRIRRGFRHSQHGRADRVGCGPVRVSLAIVARVGLRGALGRMLPRGRYLPLGSCPCRSRGFGTRRPPAMQGHGGVAMPTAEAAPLV